MSLSLTLVFERFHPSAEPILASNKLSFGYVDATLVDALADVVVPFKDGVEWPDDETGLVLRHTDPYGRPLTYVPAALLGTRLAIAAKAPWSQAVVTFIGALPASTRVVLWWH